MDMSSICPFIKRKHLFYLERTRFVMVIGKVVGSIVSTRKCDNLIGNKFMIIDPLEEMQACASRFVAIDNIGAGVGETVLVATGSAARVGNEGAPVDAAIVGIVDEGQ